VQTLTAPFLTTDEVREIVRDGLKRMDLARKRVLTIIPDGTRTVPMPLLFDTIQKEIGPRAAQLDFLVALGTHRPMTDAQLSRHVGREVTNGVVENCHIFNHRWSDPEAFVNIGTIPGEEIAELSGQRLRQDVPVGLNRMILDYDHLLICGPVFPHEVAGFSGGTKYLFPGIAAPEIIHFTHWLGALATSYEIIGRRDTPVRRVIDRAAKMVPRPHSLIALVTAPGGQTAGVFCGSTADTWNAAAELSSQQHIVWVEKPYQRALAIMPEMYEDLWTGGKGMYKMEPAIADGGEVVIYAPHIREVSYVHGPMIEEIGYHCRDYFLAQWDKFSHYPGGILAHSTHVKGQGTYNDATGVETPRITVTLATGISEERCRKINLGYLDPLSIDREEWRARQDDGWMIVPRAGEMLHRLCTSR
jgi:nickel-dependent lactate racemase